MRRSGASLYFSPGFTTPLSSVNIYIKLSDQVNTPDVWHTIVVTVLNRAPAFTFVPDDEKIMYAGGTEFVKLKYYDPDGVPVQLIILSG